MSVVASQRAISSIGNLRLLCDELLVPSSVREGSKTNNNYVNFFQIGLNPPQNVNFLETTLDNFLVALKSFLSAQNFK